MILSFLHFLHESLFDTPISKTPSEFSSGKSWYNSKTGQITPIEGHSEYNVQTGIETPGANGLTDATYHGGFVAKNLEHFGITPEEVHESILQFEKPNHELMQTPEGQKKLAAQRLDQLQTGAIDKHPGVESLIMSRGWVRVNRYSDRHGETVYAEGKASSLLTLAKKVYHYHPEINSLSLDVHGANQTYGHLDPSIQGMAHALEGRDDILDFIERRGAPHRSYTRIVRVHNNPS